MTIFIFLKRKINHFKVAVKVYLAWIWCGTFIFLGRPCLINNLIKKTGSLLIIGHAASSTKLMHHGNIDFQNLLRWNFLLMITGLTGLMLTIDYGRRAQMDLNEGQGLYITDFVLCASKIWYRVTSPCTLLPYKERRADGTGSMFTLPGS